MPRVLAGIVVSTKSAKTAVVRVDRRMTHPLYHKPYTVSKKYHVHDEKSQAHEGDSVSFQECAPKSRLKRWELLKVTKTGDSA